MKDVICWKPDEVYSIINVDADTVAPAVFWAVDSETPLMFAEGERGERTEQSTAYLLERFLDPNRDWSRMAVLGPSGAGKSHLVRRLHNEMRDRPGLRVVLVQRMQTNLRAILELLIAEAPEEARERYLQELAQAGHVLTSAAVQKNALLDSLAQAIQEDEVRADSGLDPDEESFLLEYIPHLFRDPYLRNAKWLRDGEVVPELVDRQFSERGGKRIEDELLFIPANLPLEGISLADCAVPARDAISYYLYNAEEYQPRVLSVINRNLPRAIQKMLNFSGEKLVELMSDIRRSLAKEGMELVLLFEEFARLQGYDRAMLEALLDEPNPDTPEADRPCKLRWALACTRGRFDGLEDTVRRRIDFVVDMDTVTVTQDLPTFSGKYLNALRWGRTELEAARTSGQSLANFCVECPHRRTCHAAFGASNEGIGLYPFTKDALATMARRKALDADGRLIPRLFQQYVLHPVLADDGRDIAENAFPSKALLDKMGGAQMPATDRQRLQQKAGARSDRYLALFELWSDGRLANAPAGVSDAFGLEDLNGFDTVTERLNESKAPVSQPLTLPTAPVTAQSRDVKQIAAWVEGGALDQSLAQDLRQLLYDWIDSAIDWDGEMLASGLFSNATSTGGLRPFTRTSIAFANQTTSGTVVGGKAAVQLTLPLHPDEKGFADTAAALERLMAFKRTKDWAAIGGLTALASVTELVQACADEVLRQIRALREAADGWDPVSGAVELLLTGAALGGVLPSAPNDADLATALFANIPDNTGLEPPLRELYELLRKKRPDLIKIVRSHASGSKGGRLGRFVAPQVFMPAARRYRRGKWMLGQTPQLRAVPYRDVDSWYQTIQTGLRPALTAEQKRRQEWLAELAEAFGGEGVRKTEMLAAVTTALDATAQAGLPVSRVSLETAKEAFASTQFDAAVAAARTVVAANPPESELIAFGRGGRGAAAIGGSRALIQAWGVFLTSAEAEAAARREQQGGSELSEELDQLASVVDDVLDDLKCLEAANEPA
nr:protein DpdH [Brevundimonas diminuta]